MKRKYEKPNMNIETFQSNEYIAACYAGVCNVKVDEHLGSGNVLYTEVNGKDGYQVDIGIKDDKRVWTNNTPCGAHFDVKGDIKTYMWDSNGIKKGGIIKKVYYWSDGRTTHVSDQIAPGTSSH